MSQITPKTHLTYLKHSPHIPYVILISSTFSIEELESVQELIKAFFPEVKVKVEDLNTDLTRPKSPASIGGGCQRAVKSSMDSTNIQWGLNPPLNEVSFNRRRQAETLPNRIRTGFIGVIRFEREGDGPLFAFWGIKTITENHAGFSQEYSEVMAQDKFSLTVEDITKILAFDNISTEAPRKFLLKHAALRLLSQVSGRELPWGILTGIRPSKLAHKMDDQKLPRGQQVKVLTERYAIRADKAQLLQDIASVQRPYLEEFASEPKHTALYLGIPFCPTRCSYCSFPAYAIDRGRKDLGVYLQALYHEIALVGEMMAGFGLRADSLYLGGGTPTVLTVEELTLLFEEIKRHLPLATGLEFSVEAGRPETLTPKKFALMRDAGVNRLSVNPQTMQAATLKRIGRAHRVEDVFAAYKLAREYSNWVINMDLILGLPGEGIAEVEGTLELLHPLEPDNLTVHTLALKRGSREWEQGYQHTSSAVMEEMQNLTRNVVQGWGLRPYYLYRQKQIAGNLENVGYAKPGRECRYNIAIMEERQSVIGLGAGASSKIVLPDDYSLTNFQHPSDWKSYAENWHSGHAKRMQALEVLWR